jgi:hypothetical protein
MIYINYVNDPGNSSLGNHLFQYCIGRILAEKCDFWLVAAALPNFPNAAGDASDIAYMQNTICLTGHVLDESLLFNNDGSVKKQTIIIDGFFQRYEYYKPYKEQIRNDWLKTVDVFPAKKSCNIHLRLTDYLEHNQTIALDYYVKCVKLRQAELPEEDKITIVNIITDDSNHPLCKELIDRLGEIDGILDVCAITRDDEFEDFLAIQAADTIVLSQSTFGWWAAFLSKASRIYFPVSKHGYWSEERPDIDLWVDDEDRYIKVEE